MLTRKDRFQAPRELTVLPPPSGASTYVAPGTPPDEATALIAAAHPALPRKAARRRRVAPVEAPRPTAPHVVLHNNRPVMSVPLTGELGAGKRFLVDLLTFDRMALFTGEEWTLIQPSGPGTATYVASNRKRAQRAAAGDSATLSRVRLARWITHAPSGTVVTYRDGDALNLTGGNLIVEDREEFWETHRVHRKPRTAA